MKTWNSEKDEEEGGGFVGTVLNKGNQKQQQPEEEKKFTAFTGQGVSLSGPKPTQTDIPPELAAYADDPELAYAMKMSMMEH